MTALIIYEYSVQFITIGEMIKIWSIINGLKASNYSVLIVNLQYLVIINITESGIIP